MSSALATLGDTIRSQARTALVNRTLWSSRHLLGAVQLSARWSLRPDGTAPQPLAIAWYLTHACPESCDFCNVSRVLEQEVPALPFKSAQALVDRLVPQIPVVALGGGEPMAHPHVLPLIQHIHERGGRVFVVSSGTTIGPSRARELCRLHPEMVAISLLGDQASHDARMGRQGAWRRTLGAIEHIQRHRDPRRTRLIINCTIGPDEASQIDAVVDTARRLGVDALRFTWLSFMSPAQATMPPRAQPYLVLPDAQIAAFDVPALLETVRRVQRDHAGFVQFLPGLDDAQLHQWFTGPGLRRACLSLWHTLFLRPDGQAVPCGHMQDQPLVDALTQPLPEWWNSEPLRALRMTQRSQPFEMCARCCKI